VSSAIGIDLGTTSACAAHLGAQGIRFLCPVPEGIPAILAFNDAGELLVGTAAKAHLREFPASGISASKRLIGKKANNVAQQVRQLFTYELEDGEDDDLLIRIQDTVMTLTHITAAILGEVKRLAEIELDQPITEAVITVPAYFNQRQREAVRSAAKAADLTVLSLLNEPTAAALAYGQGKGLRERVAVFDLGGGTLDIAVVDIKNNVFEVVAAGGDTFLGGVDFDEAIAEWAMAAFLKENTVNNLGPFALARIHSAAEEAKIILSENEETSLFVPALANNTEGDSDSGVDLRMPLSREQLEFLTQGLVEQSLKRLQQVLELTADTPLSKLLIMGGQSQMPSLKAALIQRVGPDLETQADPRTSVAAGAAIYAATLSGNPAVSLSERLPLAVGIALPDGSVHTLFPAGEALPARCSRQFTTHQDQQTEVVLNLVQGPEDSSSDWDRLGTLRLNGLREAPAGTVQLSVRFKMDEEGRLNIRAINPSTGEKVETHLDTAAPPVLENQPLPGLADLRTTLQAEASESAGEIIEEAPPQLPAPVLLMPALAPLPIPPQVEPIAPSKPVVQLGDNSPYPFHLSFRDWIVDFLGGLFGR
jgi:molecular chaperone DnaK